jgi:hypothetical protein
MDARVGFALQLLNRGLCHPVLDVQFASEVVYQIHLRQSCRRVRLTKNRIPVRSSPCNVPENQAEGKAEQIDVAQQIRRGGDDSNSAETYELPIVKFGRAHSLGDLRFHRLQSFFRLHCSR